MALAFLAFACGEDGGDPPPAPQPVADFTMEADEEDPYLIHFTSTSENAEEYLWTFGDGETSTEENPSHTYEASGDFEVTLQVTNGELTDEATQTLTIESPGGVPTGQNIIEGGDMEDPDAWTVQAGTDETVDHEFSDGALTFTGTAAEEITYQTHVWQAIEVEADQEYLFFANVEGGGFENAYLEIVIGPVPPEEGENYAPSWYPDPENEEGEVEGLTGIHPESGKVAGINFWIGGGGAEPFNGNILDEGIATDPAGLASDAAGEASTNGRITFPESGTVYLLMKAGNWNGTMGDGVSVNEIFLAPIVEE